MMQTLANWVFGMSLAVLLPVALINMACTIVLNRYVRSAHPDLWARISPQPFGQTSLSSPNARFITQRKYREAGDSRLDALGDRSFIAMYVSVTLFLAVVLSGLVCAISK